MSTDKITGTLIVEGRKVDLAKTAVTVKGTRCYEKDLPRVGISVDHVPAAKGQYAPPLLGFSGTPGTAALGVAHEVWVDDSDMTRGRSEIATAHAYVSPKNRGSSLTLPSKGWVRFIKLERMGPIELEFDLDFAKLGHVQGHISLDKTDEIVCRSPSPPSPPR